MSSESSAKNSSANDSSSNDSGRSGVPQKNGLEWIVFAVSLILVAATVGYLIFSAVKHRESPPVLSVALGKVQPAGSQFRVPVTISNDGETTAEGVQIEVTLNESRPDEEKATFTVAYLPHHSRREGAVLFKTDPQKGRLQARVLGYVDP
jgi:uncharacterized protein (TIGR02588 family)